MKKTSTEVNARAANYMREHRRAWKEAGFPQVSMMVHEEDKDMLLSFSAMLKYERLLKKVEAGDSQAIELAVGRKVNKMPGFEDVLDVEAKIEKAENEVNKTQASLLLKAAGNYLKKYRAHKVLADDDDMDDVARAKSVVYGNLVNVTVQYASALINSHK